MGESAIGGGADRNESERIIRVHEQNEVRKERGVSKLSRLSTEWMNGLVREGAVRLNFEILAEKIKYVAPKLKYLSEHRISERAR